MQTARYLASLPSTHIIIGCRNLSLGRGVADELNNNHNDNGNSKNKGTGCVECIQLDLTSFASVKLFANAVINKIKQLGVPIHGLSTMPVLPIFCVHTDRYQQSFKQMPLISCIIDRVIIATYIKKLTSGQHEDDMEQCTKGGMCVFTGRWGRKLLGLCID